MEVVGIVARVTLGAVYLVAGVFKLVAGAAWPRQAADLGVPRRVAVAVPYGEIALGAALATQLLRPWPAIASIVLLVAFTVVIVRRLGDASRPPCACFGTRSSRPLGPLHLIRNAILLMIAIAALW